MEDCPDFVTGDFAALGIRLGLDDLRELNLELPRQIKGMVFLQEVGNATLAGLRVHANNGLVVAPHVLRVDRQIGHSPQDVVEIHVVSSGIRLHRFKAFFDGVLVGATKGRVNKVTGPRASLVDGQLVAVLGGALEFIQVAEINLWVNPLREQVQAQCNQVHVSGALTVAEQAPFNPVSTSHVAKLCCCNSGAPVIVRVQAQNHVFAVVQVSRHPLNRIRIQIRCCHFHRGRQVDDDFAIWGGLEDFQHLVTHLECEIQLGTGVALWGVLVVDVRPWNHGFHRLTQPGAL